MDEQKEKTKKEKKGNGFVKFLKIVGKILWNILKFTVGIIFYLFVSFITMVIGLFAGTDFGKGFRDGFWNRKPKDTVYTVYENGYERTLRRDGSYNGHDRYKDDTGRYWYTDDNGSTFYRE